MDIHGYRMVVAWFSLIDFFEGGFFYIPIFFIYFFRHDNWRFVVFILGGIIVFGRFFCLYDGYLS